MSGLDGSSKVDSDEDCNLPSRGNKHLCSRTHEQHHSNGNAKTNHKRRDILDEDTASKPCGRGHIYSCWWCESILLLRQATSIPMRTSKVQKSLPVCLSNHFPFHPPICLCQDERRSPQRRCASRVQRLMPGHNTSMA